MNRKCSFCGKSEQETYIQIEEKDARICENCALLVLGKIIDFAKKQEKKWVASLRPG